MNNGSNYYQQSRTEILKLVDKVPSRVLDIGCGKGGVASMLRKHNPNAKIVGFDKYHDNTFDYQATFERFFRVDLSDNWPDIDYEEFDLVLLLDVLEHVEDPLGVLNKLKEKLNPAAKIVISLPNFHYYSNLVEIVWSGRFLYKESGILDKTHIRFFGEKDARELIENNFRIEMFIPHHLNPRSYLSRLIQMVFGVGYSAYQNIYLCSAKAY